MRAKDQRTVRIHQISSRRRLITKLTRRHRRLMASFLVLALLGASMPLTAQPTHSRKGFQQTSTQSPSRLSHILAGIVATINDWISPGTGSTASSVYYPVAHLISASPPVNAPTNVIVTATASAGVTLSWTAPQGSVDQYSIERSESLTGVFVPVANVSGTSYVDPSVLNLHAYLYRVRAISGGSQSSPSNLVFATAISFEFTELDNQGIKARHVYDVRAAVNAVRGAANLAPASWVRGTLEGLTVKADDVLEMRTALNQALTALNIPITPYDDSALTAGMFIKATHLEQLQTRSTRGSSNSSGPLDADFSVARLDPLNETGGGGENPLSRNFNWTLPLLSLPGRAGMDLGLTLSYNSLIWVKSGNHIVFDDDRGFPAPGFRLGFPVIKPLYFNSEVQKFAFLLVSPDGSRTELRQVGTSPLYEAADSSYLLLDSNTMILRTSDGTSLTYILRGQEFNCTEIKDRNGNYITIQYGTFGIEKVIDTLGRNINFNYVNGRLMEITQEWNQTSDPETHYWAKFEYQDKTLDINFSGMTLLGTADGASINTLSRVKLADNSRHDFTYTTWGQVWKIENFAPDGHLLNHRTYNLPQTGEAQHTDCPRFTARRDWAQYWNGDTDGTVESSEEVVTTFAVPASDGWTMPDGKSYSGIRAQVTAPDGTSNKIYFISAQPITKCPKGQVCLPGASTPLGWHRGLPALVNTYDSSGGLRRQTMTTWTQDNRTLSFPDNPRVIETNVYDPSGNRARTRIDYATFNLSDGTNCRYPQDVYEYAADAATVLRRSHTDYNMTAPFTNRRILGLPAATYLCDGAQGEVPCGDTSGTSLLSKNTFQYDEAGSIQGTDAPVQQDNLHYGPTFLTGRANLTSLKRHNVIDSQLFTTTRTKYNTAGSVVSTLDALSHETTITYVDSFSDNNPRNTFAYPTTVTDADLNSITSKYNFDFGGETQTQTPKPNQATYEPGPVQVIAYDAIGRVQQVTNLVNNAHTRFEYALSQVRLDTYTTIKDGAGETKSFQITDGLGRVIATAAEHPGSAAQPGGQDNWSGQKVVYDTMGRVIKMSNPTETTAEGTPSQWNAVGDDALAGWIYTEQTYDWKGRPLVTTNPSLTSNPAETTTKQLSYSGCGCAGSEVATLTDEVGRRLKVYSDVLGRNIKVERLDFDANVYSAIVNSYNARDQVERVKQFAGPEGSATFQETTMTFDGYGRLKTRHLPDQQVDPNNSASTDHTTVNYNDDDTVQSVVDARGVVTNFTYNKRHLPKTMSFDISSIPTSANVVPTGSVSLSYDAVGNRTSMSDGSGSVDYHYDQLSRMDWEERRFSGLPAAGSFRLSYEYNLAGGVTKVTDQRSSTSIAQSLDKVGRVTAVTGTGFGGAQTPFASQMRYRASNALKSRQQGNNTTLSYTYNSRGLVKSFSVAGLGASYDYYNDGKIKFVRDQSFGGDPIRDRAYGYDHAGRMKESYSGVEAREFIDNTSGGTPNGPYQHSYAYDHWDNIVATSGRFWSRNETTIRSYDSTNRHPFWSYDAEGHVVSLENEPAVVPFQPLRFNYDAAGREVGSSQIRSHIVPEEGTITNAFVNTQTIDSDGQLVHFSLLRNISLNGNLTSSIPEKTYFLRSTVLEGRAISEYNDDGSWRLTYVYAGDERIGRLGRFNDIPVNDWNNQDPVTGDGLMTVSNGQLGGHTLLDDGGVNVGSFDPFPGADPDGIVPNDGSPASKSVAGLSGGSGRSKCVLDGLEVECSFIRGESSVQCPNNDCGTRTVTVTTKTDDGRVVGIYNFLRSRGEFGWDGSLDGAYKAIAGNIQGLSANFRNVAGAIAFVDDIYKFGLSPSGKFVSERMNVDFQRRQDGRSGMRPSGTDRPVAQDRLEQIMEEAKANEISRIRDGLMKDCINREFKKFATEAIEAAGPSKYLQARLASITSRPTLDELGPSIVEILLKGKLSAWFIPATGLWREFKAHARNFMGVFEAAGRYDSRRMNCITADYNSQAQEIYRQRHR